MLTLKAIETKEGVTSCVAGLECDDCGEEEPDIQCYFSGETPLGDIPHDVVAIFDWKCEGIQTLCPVCAKKRAWEVKADNQIEDAVVQAKKDFAQQIAVASGMEYRIIKSTDADKRAYRVLM